MHQTDLELERFPTVTIPAVQVSSQVKMLWTQKAKNIGLVIRFEITVDAFDEIKFSEVFLDVEDCTLLKEGLMYQHQLMTSMILVGIQ